MKKLESKQLLKDIQLKMVLNKNQRVVILMCVLSLMSICACNLAKPSKINGISFVAPRQYIEKEAMTPILELKANWIAITPYAFSPGNSPEIIYENNDQWWGERKKGIITQIKYAHELNLKIMVKPHVWVRGQGWAGDFDLESREQWENWAISYSDYILSYAKIADSMNVEMLCIGTEYRKSAASYPDIWRQLIVNVREVYTGKVVYAANWDNYENIEFWDQLDYIGIDAYFPLSDQKSPTLHHLNERWKNTKSNLEQFSSKWNKPIIFTEFGFQSIDYATDGHWKHDQDTLAVNLPNQVVAYQSVFDTFWNESWFHGGFLWKWHANHLESGGNSNKRFTPQNKPAQKTITDWYRLY